MTDDTERTLAMLDNAITEVGRIARRIPRDSERHRLLMSALEHLEDATDDTAKAMRMDAQARNWPTEYALTCLDGMLCVLRDGCTGPAAERVAVQLQTTREQIAAGM